MILLCGLNYLDLEDTFEFVLGDLGADKLKVNMLQLTFGSSSDRDEFFEEHSRMDADRLMEILRHCDVRHGLGYNPAWIAQVGMYARLLASAPREERGWQHSIKTPEQICNSGERNIVVDMHGMIRRCVTDIFPGMIWQRPGDLCSFWEGGDGVVEAMKSCRNHCGISHCSRRLSSTIGGATHFE